jgi:ADP-ribose pyrophosphatase YjhB (NUDIX family)
MNFCPACGKSVSSKIPDGDHLPRFVCDACATIHYENPRVIAGCIPDWEGKLLLCRRAIEPRRGFWTVPAGFMENGEAVQDAAAREAQEEALADVEIGSLVAMVNVIRAHQVHIIFRARLKNTDFGVGPESLEVGLFDERDIPWPEIAFLSVEFALRRYFDDRHEKRQLAHFRDIDWKDGELVLRDR